MAGDKSGKVIVRFGKGRKYREIPLHKEARKVLTVYLDVRPTDQGVTLFLDQRGTTDSSAGVSLPHV
jgi:site-specific recombinase XerC